MNELFVVLMRLSIFVAVFLDVYAECIDLFNISPEIPE